MRATKPFAHGLAVSSNPGTRGRPRCGHRPLEARIGSPDDRHGPGKTPGRERHPVDDRKAGAPRATSFRSGRSGMGVAGLQASSSLTAVRRVRAQVRTQPRALDRGSETEAHLQLNLPGSLIRIRHPEAGVSRKRSVGDQVAARIVRKVGDRHGVARIGEAGLCVAPGDRRFIEHVEHVDAELEGAAAAEVDRPLQGQVERARRSSSSSSCCPTRGRRNRPAVPGRPPR